MCIRDRENGKCLIVVQSDRYLSYMTLLREQNAELMLKEYDGLRVPKNALRVDENGVSGVYCLVGRVAYFKPVSIVYQGLSLIHILDFREKESEDGSWPRSRR